MEWKEQGREIFVILLAIVLLAVSISFSDTTIMYKALLSFAIIIIANVIAKKITAYLLEADIKIRFWSWYQYGLKKGSHFKKPLPMAWLPLLLSLVSQGMIWWMAILEFDVKPRTERVSRRHGLYRFTEMTGGHLALIATIGIITNLVLGVIGYVAGFELFAKLSIFYAAWSLIPISNLDGTKILFGSRGLWFTMFVILAIFLGWGLSII